MKGRGVRVPTPPPLSLTWVSVQPKTPSYSSGLVELSQPRKALLCLGMVMKPVSGNQSNETAVSAAISVTLLRRQQADLTLTGWPALGFCAY